MKSRMIWLLVLMLSLVLSACGAGGPATTPTPAGDLAAGKKVFTSTCVGCHGPDAKGLPGLGKDMTTSEFIRSKSTQELVEFIKVGRPVSDPLNTTGVDMPPKGGNPALNDTDLYNVAAYIHSIQE